MKALQLEQPKQWRIIDVPAPGAPGPGEALLRVERVGVCGTDLSGYLILGVTLVLTLALLLPPLLWIGWTAFCHINMCLRARNWSYSTDTAAMSAASAFSNSATRLRSSAFLRAAAVLRRYSSSG